ncbi:prepilin peptidase [Nocardioides sp. GY 10113]|uniref:prepilin peptidase n=1 Tax=Nocardioides sp. GY 10113 TaxID=2569761 RepID=UPI0010A900EE|nr:prepilin peptidase [Nocardioides sp. GY 10113]TIC80366.1 prepilin peptidase [Nocardioides sp. GY 10113]TIC82473.1 prepilin peptidase [Nocardioides sp. GY 10113]
MEWHLGAAALCAAAGTFGGTLVPRMIAALPEPEPDPDEDPGDFPAKVPYAELASRPRLAWGCAAACTLAAGLLGGVVGWSWALTWLLVLVPVCCALAVVDYVTWYLPSRLIWPTAAIVAVLVAVGAAAVGRPEVLVAGAVGFLGLGGYYGLLWLASPRIMAFGDVRLGALLGLGLGPFGVPTVVASVLAAAVLGAVALLPLRRAGNAIRRHIPFGPFLALGALAGVLLGQVPIPG